MFDCMPSWLINGMKAFIDLIIKMATFIANMCGIFLLQSNATKEERKKEQVRIKEDVWEKMVISTSKIYTHF